MARLEAEKQAAVRKKKTIRYGIIGTALLALVIGLVVITGTGGSDSSVAPTAAGVAPKVVVPAGAPPKTTTVKVTDLRAGTGAVVKLGDTVKMRYTGVAWSTKKQFDSNWGAGKELFSVVGIGTPTSRVIKGWDNIVGMKVGGRRQLIIPPELGYGKVGAGSDIGPNETLVFVVDAIATAPTAKVAK
jgi:peptidylprolyl isomerase